jgi:hypothetical protein
MNSFFESLLEPERKRKVLMFVKSKQKRCRILHQDRMIAWYFPKSMKFVTIATKYGYKIRLELDLGWCYSDRFLSKGDLNDYIISKLKFTGKNTFLRLDEKIVLNLISYLS